ncbi:zinc finger protein 729-like [Sabethes cyaneus]|uniref:zinc finger protein 729-like n=1 Tax=Sabethes cyaneus TaxID=53552 RepID=UPI00237E658C|nr:zinc finger protein 729-like [Sabethes cyaneus]
MVLLKLEQYPIVCRLCFKPATKKGMIPLKKKDPVFDGTIESFITAITIEIAEPNIALLPQAICQDCYESLKFFAKFRAKLLNMHLFMNSLAELKHSNSAPMIELFQSKSAKLAILFKDLDLCTKQPVTVEDLLEEFPKYYVAKMTVEQKKAGQGEEPIGIFAEECTADEIAELIPEAARKKSKTYPCFDTTCTEIFPDSRSRRKHNERIHKPHICDTCGMRFGNAGRLANHKERHLNLYSHCCTYCGLRTNTKQDLRTHINVRHNAAYFFPCEICGVRFKRKSSMTDHMNGHTDNRLHKCDRCSKSFLKLAALRRHKRMVHEKITVACEHCGEAFLRTEFLRDHIEYVHGIQVRFFCDICLLVFNSSDALSTHKLRHASPQELECGTCLDVFASNELMEAHTCITYRNDYVCCGKDYFYHRNYNKHMLVDHGVRTNVRVKPDPNHLWGYIRTTRNQRHLGQCPKCATPFQTGKEKKQHLLDCCGTTLSTKKGKPRKKRGKQSSQINSDA